MRCSGGSMHTTLPIPIQRSLSIAARRSTSPACPACWCRFPENQVIIDPAKKNELRDSPLYRSGFLNGATIYLDPRISGVRDDGVPWIGSPLIDATA